MAAFGDLVTAAKLRDVMRQLVGTEIELQRPGYAYGTVTAIDRAAPRRRRCWGGAERHRRRVERGLRG